MKLMGQMVKKKKGDACIRLRTEEVKPWVNPVLRLDVQERGFFGWECYEPNCNRSAEAEGGVWFVSRQSAACNRRLYLSRRGKGLWV